MTISVIINDVEHTFDDRLTVTAMLDAMELKPEKVAIERNEEVIPRSTYKTAMIENGDIIEIVHFIGGG